MQWSDIPPRWDATRGYNKIIFYETSTFNILKAFNINNGITPLQHQINLFKYEESSDPNDLLSYAVYYVSTPASITYVERSNEQNYEIHHNYKYV